jgi:hypothetical protein
MSEYIPVPVEAAKQVARQFEKSVVVIAAWDRAFNKFHTASYGESADDKIVAANLADLIPLAAGCDPQSLVTHEDFRHRTEAGWAVERHRLLDMIRGPATQREVEAAAEAIANARGCRRGVPSITNLLQALPQKLRDEVLEDAAAALAAVAEVRSEALR